MTRFAVLFLCSVLGVACAGGGQTVCPQDPATGMSQCTTTSNSLGDAIAVTGVAAGVYAVTGCTVNGCQLPDRCNTSTKRCEPIRCSESQTCPAGYNCRLDTGLCR
jgi:hypothetical protein